MKMHFESPEELVEALSDGVLVACQNAYDPQDPNFDNAMLAGQVAATILFKLAAIRGDDNALITTKQRAEGWESHIHFDYLSADRAHFEKDFSWNTPEGDEDRKEY